VQPLARNGYTEEQIKAALHMAQGSRRIDFRYDLLDINNNFIRPLRNVVSGEVSMASLASIKRTAKFKLMDDGQIDYMNDRIQPFVRLYIPPGRVLAREYHFLLPNFPARFEEIKSAPEEGGWIDFPLGVFLLSSPTRADENNGVYREVDAYDATLILRDDKFESRYAVRTGTNYRDAIVEILESAGITIYNIDRTDKTLPTTMEFEPGTEKLTAVNRLLSAINYTPIYVDVNGYFMSREYRSPSERVAEYTYEDNDLSVTYQGMSEELDTFNVANRWVAVLSDPERQPLVSSYTNDNPNSPTSTVSRGRVIVDYREVEDIADQHALDGYVKRLASNASQVYGKLEFNTAIMPMHDYADVLQIKYSPLGINEKYSETGWTIPLEVGGRMKHSIRRVVTI
jgi:hypothetical protein